MAEGDPVVLPFPLRMDVPAGQRVTPDSFALPPGAGFTGIDHEATEDLSAGERIMLHGEAPGTATTLGL